MKRLKQPTGSVSSVEKLDDDHGDRIKRSAILVHSGPNGEEIVFQSADGEIKFDDARIKNIIKCHNEKINHLADGYGGFEKMPVGAFPPILDLHVAEDSIQRIIGRLASTLRYEQRTVPGVGENVSCVIADITWLGEETVERVNDGRIYALSIGIDEDTDTLDELSAVITPAAPGAMLLKHGSQKNKNTKEGKIMSTKLKELKAKRLATLSAIKDAVSKSKTNLDATKKSMHLAKKKGEITHRLTGLMRSGKLTPAEFKKMDITRLSAQSEEAVSMVFDAFEVREPQVLVGQYGTTDAVDFMDLSKNMKNKDFKRLKDETKLSLTKLSRKKLSFKDDGTEEDKDHGQTHEMSEDVSKKENEVKAAADQASDNAKFDMSGFKSMMAEMKKHLEEGNIDEAKKKHEEMTKHCEGMEDKDVKHMSMSDVKSEDYKQSMDELQTQIDELNTQISRVAGMVDELMTVEKEEGHDLSEGDKEMGDTNKLEDEIKEDIKK